ncbi:MAG TPA: hypothetical protein VNM47_12395 [Terriglobia bacterium]|nr:hypothetical protein [Terriglobia bacterium]
MANAKKTIAIVPSTEFKWTAQIQYQESLPTREEAIRYAGLHGFNLIVQYERRSGPLFDVMNDPNLTCLSEISSNSFETVSVEIEPEAPSRRKKVARGIFGLFARRPDTATVTAH